jgi:hypothetical protein
MIDLDFTGVGNGDFPVLDEGDYVLTITDVELKPAKPSTDGKQKFPTLWVSYEAQDAKLKDFMSLNPDSLWRIRIWLEAITGEVHDGPLSFDEKELIGQQVGATVIVEPRYDDKDKMTNKIKSFVPASEV